LLIDFGIFALDDLGVFQTNNSIGTMENITITNGIYDEFHLQSSTSGTFTTSLDNWTSPTVLLAKFQNSLSAGNIYLNGMIIENLLIKKRKINTLTWEDVVTLSFNNSIVNYSYIDNLVEGSETYEYAVFPSTSTVTGDYIINNIDVDFEGAFLLDKNSNYQLLYNLELGDVNLNIPNSTVELLGAQYPIIMYSSDVQYKSGSLKAMLVSNTTATGSGIDAVAEKIYRKTLMDFLTNKNPKILKDMGGQYILINIVGAPKLTPNNSLNGFIYDLSFDWVEVGNATNNDSLILAGIKE
jgi:hypothetical protein